MTRINKTLAASDVVLAFSGELDTRGAEELASLVAQNQGAAHLVIDLSRAWPIEDKALGRLVEALPRTRPHVVRGTGPHHRRLLECLGAVVEETVRAES
jgi:anti-anti-sigma regulatory factor